MALERDGFPPGVPCWIDTAQPDPEAAAAFYGALFGWEMEGRMPAEAPGHHFVARLRGRDVAGVGSQFDGGPATPVWSTYIWVERAEDTVAMVAGNGGSVLMEPFDVLDAGRMAVCADPAGAVFNLWQPGTHRGAQAVNEPGTWNWSDLVTADIEGPRRSMGGVRLGGRRHRVRGSDVAPPRLRRFSRAVRPRASPTPLRPPGPPSWPIRKGPSSPSATSGPSGRC